MRTNRFTNPQVLRRVGIDLLTRFFDSFAEDFRGKHRGLPPPDLPDEDYYQAVSHLLKSANAVPDCLLDTLGAIEEISAPQAQDQLDLAVRQAGLALPPGTAFSREDLALQVWLAAPSLITHFHNLHHLRRLTSFAYFGNRVPRSQRPPFRPPGSAELKALTDRLDAWFALHSRGQHTTRVEDFSFDEELWFLVRHGDMLARMPSVEAQRTKVIHFRPQKDDVVAYSPAQDRIRVNARTKGERELYRREFGACLRASEDYFCETNTYTLEPLRTQGRAALGHDGIDEIIRVTLREIQIAMENRFHEIDIRSADDLFQCAGGSGISGNFPIDGNLTSATFELWLKGCPRPRSVQIRPPNTLRLSRHCNPDPIHRWLHQSPFLVAPSLETTGVQTI